MIKQVKIHLFTTASLHSIENEGNTKNLWDIVGLIGKYNW